MFISKLQIKANLNKATTKTVSESNVNQRA